MTTVAGNRGGAGFVPDEDEIEDSPEARRFFTMFSQCPVNNRHTWSEEADERIHCHTPYPYGPIR